MKRKVSKIGPSTLMVSLPAKWIKKYGIQKGQELEVIEEESTIIIKSNSRQEIKKTEIDVSNFEGLILRCLAAVYKRGYDEVDLVFTKEDTLTEIQNSLKNEISDFEIVEQEKNRCKIKSIAEGLEEQFDVIFRRTLLLLVSMAEDFGVALKKNDLKSLMNTAYLEETNNRFTTFCRRILNKYGYKEQEKITFIYYLVEELENIADQYKYACKYFHEKKNVKIRKEILSLNDTLTSMLRDFYEFYYKYDKEKVASFSKKRKDIIASYFSMIEKYKLNKDEIVLLHYIMNLNQQVFQLLGPYLAMKL